LHPAQHAVMAHPFAAHAPAEIGAPRCNLALRPGVHDEVFALAWRWVGAPGHAPFACMTRRLTFWRFRISRRALSPMPCQWRETFSMRANSASVMEAKTRR